MVVILLLLLKKKINATTTGRDGDGRKMMRIVEE
jgi:hypothetical protein